MTTSRSPAALPLDEATTALLRRLLRDYVRPQAGRIALALVCMAATAACTAAFTQLMKPVINEIFVARRADMLLPIALAALAVFALKGLATYGHGVLMGLVGQHIVADMQRRLFDRLMGAELAYFNRTSPGELVSRFVNDVQVLRHAVANSLTGIGKDSLTLAALVGVMFYEDWLLAAIASVAFPAAVVPITRIGLRMRRVSERTQEEMGRLTTLLDEVFQGIRTVKAYAMEAAESARARRTIEEVRDLAVRAARTRNALHPIMETLGGLAIVAVILYGGDRVISGAKDPGAFFAFITALLLAYEPMKRLARLNANLQEGLAAAQRVFRLMDREPGLVDARGARPLEVRRGEIAFERVSFAYAAGGAPRALSEVSLTVPPGRTAALVGPSGAGKSTVLNLIPRFYDAEAGAVTIDGQDVRAVTVDSLRRAIALVSQESLLFDDTVRANVAYGRPGAGEAEITEAVRAAGAEGFVGELPRGLDTPVGPRGERLSGGQRQRIAIARAMLKDAPILLLDEATSALDSETESQVREALGRLMRGRTTLVIAHRLSTVMGADVIYVMDSGRVVEQGRHGELLARGGLYARLYAMQFAEQAPEAAAGPRPAAGARA